jgi:hypothetical protein
MVDVLTSVTFQRPAANEPVNLEHALNRRADEGWRLHTLISRPDGGLVAVFERVV